MASMSGSMGELRMQVQITRKETGKVEQVELVGKCTEDEAKELGAEIQTKEGEK